MKTYLKCIDILDQPADALIYSCNVQLNCSGGVGAALMMRYGEQVQHELHDILRKQNRKFADRGEWFQWVTPGLPYRAVFHTVPCDGWYETTREVVALVLRECLAECRRLGNIHTVACAALATGYGRLPFEEFFRIASSISQGSMPLQLYLCVADGPRYSDACKLIASEQLSIQVWDGGST